MKDDTSELLHLEVVQNKDGKVKMLANSCIKKLDSLGLKELSFQWWAGCAACRCCEAAASVPGVRMVKINIVQQSYITT